MFSLIFMLIVVLVIPPFVSSKRKKKTNPIVIVLIIMAGLSFVLFVNLEYINLLNFWNYKYEFEENRIKYSVTFPRIPEIKQNEKGQYLHYNDDYRSVELSHIKSNIDFDIDDAIERYTKQNKSALISNKQIDNSFLLRFNRIDQNDRFIIEYKKIYLLEESYLELTFSYLKFSEKAIKGVDRYLELNQLSEGID